jgi:hypothetical protein
MWNSRPRLLRNDNDGAVAEEIQREQQQSFLPVTQVRQIKVESGILMRKAGTQERADATNQSFLAEWLNTSSLTISEER